MTGAPEEEQEKQHSISVMEISAFMIYYWWSQHEKGGRGYSSLYIVWPHESARGVSPGVSTCELSPAPESRARGCEKLRPATLVRAPDPHMWRDAGPGRGGAETAIWTSFLRFSGCNSAPRKKKPTSVTMIRLASMNVGHAARISEIILFVGAKNGPWMAAKSR